MSVKCNPWNDYCCHGYDIVITKVCLFVIFATSIYKLITVLSTLVLHLCEYWNIFTIYKACSQSNIWCSSEDLFEILALLCAANGDTIFFMIKDINDFHLDLKFYQHCRETSCSDLLHSGFIRYRFNYWPSQKLWISHSSTLLWSKLWYVRHNFVYL